MEFDTKIIGQVENPCLNGRWGDLHECGCVSYEAYREGTTLYEPYRNSIGCDNRSGCEVADAFYE